MEWVRDPSRFDLPAIGPAAAIAFPADVARRCRNGLRVWAIPWPAVPVVSMALVLPDGAAARSAGSARARQSRRRLLDEGAGSRDAIALSDALARLGARFDIEVGSDVTTIGLSTLARHRARRRWVWSPTSSFRPHLEQDALDRVRDLRLSRLKQLSRTPAAPADRAFLGRCSATTRTGTARSARHGSLRR